VVKYSITVEGLGGRRSTHMLMVHMRPKERCSSTISSVRVEGSSNDVHAEEAVQAAEEGSSRPSMASLYR
jgi:hypothetical protein